MNDYYNELPRYVEIKNEKFIIETDYRIFINFEEEMQDTDTKKAIYNALSRFYPAFSVICAKGFFNQAIDKFIWFYKCGKQDKKQFSGKSKIQDEIFNYDYDADLIYASYMMYAKVDITKYVHWWKFKAIWNNLPSECEFCKIKGYRAYTGDDNNLLELKEYYKLPPNKLQLKEEERLNKIYEVLK